MTKIPLSTVSSTLRQIDSAAVGDIFSFFFPKFYQLEEVSDYLDDAGIGLVIDGEAVSLAGRGRERRYAGDETLDRGRYHALVDSPNNEPNNNTLLNEIFAYANPTTLVAPTIIDTTVDVEAAQQMADFGIHVDEPALIQTVEPHDPSLLPSSLGLDPQETTFILYPLIISEVQIERVLDLRRPRALDWLATTFVELETTARADSKFGAPTSGIELIPSLLAQELGGGSPFLQGIGAWLRSHRINGLIYPSARSDCFVAMEGDEIVDSYGFIFLDYRGAEAVEWLAFFGDLNSWLDKASRTIQIEHQSDGESLTWGTRGVRSIQKERFQGIWVRTATIFANARMALEAGEAILSDKLDFKGPGTLQNWQWRETSIGLFLASLFPADPNEFFSPEWHHDGSSWFLHRGGEYEAELLMRCPICGWENIWAVQTEALHNACPQCRFANGPSEPVDVLRERWVQWAEDWPARFDSSDDVEFDAPSEGELEADIGNEIDLDQTVTDRDKETGDMAPKYEPESWYLRKAGTESCVYEIKCPKCTWSDHIIHDKDFPDDEVPDACPWCGHGVAPAGGGQADFEKEFSKDEKAWFRAASNGNLAKLQKLLEAGIDIEAEDMATGCTALSLASIGNHLEAVQLLLERGATINATDFDLMTALWYGREHPRIVEVLREHGAREERIS